MTSDENNSPRTGAVGGAGLSLFANLLDPSAPSTISRAPVLFANSTGPEPPRHDTITTEKKSANGSISLLAVKSKCALPSCNLKLTPSLAALRFQPTKRPQIPAQKPRTRANASGPKQISVSVETAQDSSGSAVPSTHTAIKTTIEDWTAVDDDDDNGVLAINNGMRRQRGGKKRRKRGKEDVPVPQNWDDIYDPSRPNKYEDYKQSEERERELRDWKDCLYAHRMLLRKSSSDVADSPADEPGKHNRSYNFAPPLDPDDSTLDSARQPVSPPECLGDATGDNAYARRTRMSGMSNETKDRSMFNDGLLQSENSASTSLPSHTTAILPAATISRAPILYRPPEPQSGESVIGVEPQDSEEPSLITAAEGSRSTRPGQKGFAARVMAKQGWKEGSGLGLSEEGILKPLRVQLEKRKKKSDAEGGGFVGPGGKGKILGGRKNNAAEQLHNVMSDVIVIEGVAGNTGVEDDVYSQLIQDLGEEMTERYGRVERVLIPPSESNKAQVFVKFTSQLSAMKAVDALKGSTRNGNVIEASFYDSDKFGNGIYE